MLLDAARAFAAADCCVIPARVDGSKAPAVRWEQYQLNLPGDEQLQHWFANGSHDGFGVVCGAVSGGLEMLEAEGRAVGLLPRLGQLLADDGADDLWARLCTGYVEMSPSGGMHWLYRVSGAPAKRNTKLARRPGPPDMQGRPTVDVLFETRGEGGFVITAPSAGRTHDSGRPWMLLAGGPVSIPTITADERDLLYAVANMLDQMPVIDNDPVTGVGSSPPAGMRPGDLRPGDDFNQRANWDGILGSAGWKRTRKNFAGTGAAWTRPGKEHGVSATTGTAADGVDRLYVFSTSTTFESEKPYSKFAAMAHLEYGGDLSACAKDLREAGYGSPLEEPRDSPATPPASGGAPPTSPPPVLAGPGPSSYSLTDDGNALRLVDQYHKAVRFCPQRRQWLTWQGYRWIWDDADAIRELARLIARGLPVGNKPRIDFRNKSLNEQRITAMVRLARSDSRVVVNLPDLDARPYELNTPGGVVDLRTGQLIGPDPGALHTRSTTVAPDPDGEATRWLRFLADTFAGDPELTIYVQRLLGVSLIGEVLEQKLPFPYGAGANGKTTLMNAVQRLVGIGTTGYAISAPAEILLATRNTDHPATIAQLSGARLVVTSELEDGQRFAEAKVKQLTGADPINARFMAKNPFTFVPTHTLWLLANHRPNVKAGGSAFWRRIALLPFLHTVPVERRDPHLEDALVREEGPAILAWLIAGARDYLAEGLSLPASVADATKDYELDQDTITRFVTDMCETGQHTDPLLRVKVADLRSEYEAWCHYEGEHPVNPKAFTQGLKNMFGVYTERTSAHRWYTGIRVKDLSSDDMPDSSNHGDDPWRKTWDDR